jgi:hypothetical protein
LASPVFSALVFVVEMFSFLILVGFVFCFYFFSYYSPPPPGFKREVLSYKFIPAQNGWDKNKQKIMRGGQQTKIFQKKKAIIHFERVKKQKEASI